MNAVYLSRITLTALSSALGGAGIFLIWAGCYLPGPAVNGPALICLGLAAGVMLGMPDGHKP